MTTNEIRLYNELNAKLQKVCGFQILAFGAKEKGVYGTYVVNANELNRLPQGTKPNQCDVSVYRNTIGLENSAQSVSISLPSKIDKITIETIIEKVTKKLNTEKVYQDFSDAFASILAKNGFYGRFTVYPTTYGIGVCNLYRFGAQKEEIAILEKFLTDAGIEFKNEYSDAHWVYRFKLSKKQSNIEKISSLIK